MKRTLLLLLPLLSLGPLAASAQIPQDKINQAAKDPKTEENAAKADVFIHEKKRIIDSARQSTQNTPATTKKKRSKRCHKG
jgi:hypothetical protein